MRRRRVKPARNLGALDRVNRWDAGSSAGGGCLGFGCCGAGCLPWHNDVARTGQNLRELVLTPANVNTKTFAKLFVIAVDGKVDAEPLYVHGLPMPNRGTRNVLRREFPAALAVSESVDQFLAL